MSDDLRDAAKRFAEYQAAGGEWIRGEPHEDDDMAVYEDEQLGNDLWMLAEAWVAQHANERSDR